MTELIPLARSASDDFEKELIRSARTDGPGPGAKLKMLVAFGGGAAATSAAGVAQAAATSGAVKAAATGSTLAAGTAAAGHGAVATGVGKVATLSLVKWLGAGALAGTLVSAGATAVMPSRSTGSEVARPRAAATADVTEPAAPSRPAAGALAQVPAPELSDETAADDTVSPVVSGSPAAKGDVVAELKLLDEARKAVASGDPKAALTALDTRDRKHSRGALGPEAEVLRVEALFAAGDRRAAAARAKRFLRQHPGSPHEGRVRTLLSRMNVVKVPAVVRGTAPKSDLPDKSASSSASFGAPKAAEAQPETKPNTAKFPAP